MNNDVRDFALAFEFTGWAYCAADYQDRDKPEWPPDVDRAYQAMVATLHHQEKHPYFQQRRNALLWLEKQRSPALALPEGIPSAPVHTFVPEPFSLRGEKQARRFPRTVLPMNKPTFYFIWRGVDSQEFEIHRPFLQSLMEEVSYLGTSHSHCRGRVTDMFPEPNWLPTSDGDHRLRVPVPGRMDYLEKFYAQNLPMRIRPRVMGEEVYAEIRVGRVVKKECRPTEFTEFFTLVKSPGSCSVPITLWLMVLNAVRNAIMAHGPQPPPEIISGHLPNGDISRRSHIGFFPLANVGLGPRSDGDLKGLVVCLPPCSSAERMAVLSAIRSIKQLRFPGFGQWNVKMASIDDISDSLRKDRYLRSSKKWISVTPVAFPRRPKPRHGQSQADAVAEQLDECLAQIGLPKPKRIEMIPVAPLTGTALSGHYMPYQCGGRARLHHHIVIEWDQEVYGPILIGAGKYFGMGIFLPADFAIPGEIITKSNQESQHEPQSIRPLPYRSDPNREVAGEETVSMAPEAV